ncbi:hypothetical protein [Sphingobium sp. RAC03]|uniref:hypothetical protein n=1 Tax=Sphingobium sp. RAC03 TaxID=1843368 RepID=UPI0008583C84|nr:hypothetical protein [Sphingobium sp. RAC03]AOF95125.1 hypothetical protein BSY17_3230 [Sphingobium sp. RAC03]
MFIDRFLRDKRGLRDKRSLSLGAGEPLYQIYGLNNVHVNRMLRSLREDRLCVFRSSPVEIFEPERLAQGQFHPAYHYIDDGLVRPMPSLSRVLQ